MIAFACAFPARLHVCLHARVCREPSTFERMDLKDRIAMRCYLRSVRSVPRGSARSACCDCMLACVAHLRAVAQTASQTARACRRPLLHSLWTHEPHRDELMRLVHMCDTRFRCKLLRICFALPSSGFVQGCVEFTEWWQANDDQRIILCQEAPEAYTAEDLANVARYVAGYMCKGSDS
jgi:hypothetical protein